MSAALGDANQLTVRAEIARPAPPPVLPPSWQADDLEDLSAARGILLGGLLLSGGFWALVGGALWLLLW